MRAVSTTLDVAVMLLLLTAAVATVTIPTEPAPDTEVDEAADSLASSTTAVEYGVSIPADLYDADRRLEGTRTANRTLASLLAVAAVSAATLDGTALRFRGDSFRDRVRNRTNAHLGWIDGPIRIEAEWAVYDGAPMNGSIALGRSAARETAAASLTVPSPVPLGPADALAVADDGFEAVASTVANATVAGFLPPDRMRVALDAGGLPRGLALARYDAFVRALNVDVVTELEAADAGAANARLAPALADRLEADMRSRFDGPRAAARAVSAGTVRIVVQGWEP